MTLFVSNIAEVITLSETLGDAGGEATALEDTLTISEVLTTSKEVATGVIYVSNIEDVITLSEELPTIEGQNSVLEDTLTLSEVVAGVSNTALLEDIITLSETIETIRNQNNILDTLTLSEDIVASVFFTLTVVGGTGSGLYSAGDVVQIEAFSPEDFLFWTGPEGWIDNESQASTFITIPVFGAYSTTISAVSSKPYSNSRVLK